MACATFARTRRMVSGFRRSAMLIHFSVRGIPVSELAIHSLDPARAVGTLRRPARRSERAVL
jgi:hypothetical protein